MAEEARKYLVQLQSIMGTGMHRGAMSSDPDRLANMDIVAQQDLVYQGRGMSSSPDFRMPPPRGAWGLRPRYLSPFQLRRPVQARTEHDGRTPELAKAPATPPTPLKDVPVASEPTPATAPKESRPRPQAVRQRFLRSFFSLARKHPAPPP